MTGDDDEMFITRSLNITPNTAEEHLIAHSDKSVAHVTNNKRRFVLLKLTTDRHKASRGLFATAELLVPGCVTTTVDKCTAVLLSDQQSA